MALAYSDSEILDILWRRDRLRQSAGQIAVTVGASRSAICGVLFRSDAQLRDFSPDHVADEVLLALMDDLHERGMSAESIGARLGWPPLRVLAVAHRIWLDLVKSNGPADAPRAVKPENRTGGMPQGWWAAGIWARVEERVDQIGGAA